jgi:hypothetical protein
MSSCSRNPVIGQWELDTEQSDPLAAAGQAVARMFGSGADFEFLDDKMITGSKAEPVTYDVQKSLVIVTTEAGESTVFRILDEDHISIEAAGGRLVFKRVGSDPAPEPIEPSQPDSQEEREEATP